ncbi:MAG: flagellar assembly protein A [Chitinispirillaceae bacterium]
MTLERNSSLFSENYQEFVSLTVHVSEDAMSACLILEPIEGKAGTLKIEDLKNALAQNGVVNGIDEKALEEIADKWNETPKFLESPPVAKGSTPEAGQKGKLHIKVKHLTNHKDIEKAKEARCFWEITSLSSKIQRVDPGTVIAEKGAELPAIPGKNVYGELISPDDSENENAINPGEGVSISEDKKTVSATVTGIVICAEDMPEVISLDFNGAVEVQTSADKMKAELVIQPAGEKGKMPSLKDVQELLKKNGVVKGINEQKLTQACENFNLSKKRSEIILIAEGHAAQKGEDGKVELLFDSESSLKPTINPNGSADYKNVSIINPVSAGTKLAKLHPPQKGVPGYDVNGNTLPAKDGTEAKLPAGTNTTVSKEESSVLIAAIDGIVRYNGITVDVDEGYLIPGNVDFSTGNVKYEKSVLIDGDVKSGFDVQCGGDLQVGGVIEDCHISVKGNLLCKYGFIGQGNGYIEAKGDVNLGFIKNQTVRCRGNVNVAKEVLNGTIIARKSITIHGNPISVAGGTLTSNESIVVETSGNASGVKTILEIGPDYTLTEELHRTELQIQELNTNLKKLAQTLESSDPRKQSSSQLEVLKKVKQKIATIRQQITILEQRKEVINEKSDKFDECFINIKRSALPGTVFKFGQRHYFVKEKITGPKNIRLVNLEIKVL